MFKIDRIDTTLLGHALAGNNISLAESLQKRGARILVPNTTNPIITVLHNESVLKKDYARMSLSNQIKQICKLFPELLTAGDRMGVMQVDEKNNIMHEFNPLLYVCRSEHIGVLRIFHRRGVPLLQKRSDNTTCLHVVCSKALLEIVEYILEHAPLEGIKEISGDCLERLIYHVWILESHSFEDRMNILKV